MATHSRILAWRLLRTEEPGRPQSMGSQRVRYNYSDFAHMHAPGKSQDLLSQPLSNMQCNISCYSPTVCYILGTVFFFLISFFMAVSGLPCSLQASLWLRLMSLVALQHVGACAAPQHGRWALNHWGSPEVCTSSPISPTLNPLPLAATKSVSLRLGFLCVLVCFVVQISHSEFMQYLSFSV